MILFLNLHGAFKLMEQPPAPQRKHPKLFPFILFVLVISAFLDPDTDS
jgi:hypothetical protein